MHRSVSCLLICALLTLLTFDARAAPTNSPPDQLQCPAFSATLNVIGIGDIPSHRWDGVGHLTATKLILKRAGGTIDGWLRYSGSPETWDYSGEFHGPADRIETKPTGASFQVSVEWNRTLSTYKLSFWIPYHWQNGPNPNNSGYSGHPGLGLPYVIEGDVSETATGVVFQPASRTYLLSQYPGWDLGGSDKIISWNGQLEGEEQSPRIEITSAYPIGFRESDLDGVPFCSVDTIRCEATTWNAENSSIVWRVIPDPSSGKVTSFPASSPNSNYLDFKLTRLLSGSRFLYAPRERLGFTVETKLVGPQQQQLAITERRFVQSERGQLRQEYVDHKLKPTPGPEEFKQMPIDGSWNDGHYGWAVINPWVYAAVSKASSKMGRPLRVNSVYRSPVRHWMLYKDKKLKPTISFHLWGQAVDLGVDDFVSPVGKGLEDWLVLRNVCNPDLGWVVTEMKKQEDQFKRVDVSHVHLQISRTRSSR